MRKLGIIALILVVFAGVVKAEEGAAAQLVPPNYDYFEYAADSDNYLQSWTKFLSSVMTQKADNAPEFTFVSIYDTGLPKFMCSLTDLILVTKCQGNSITAVYMCNFADLTLSKETTFKFSAPAKEFLHKYYPELTNYQFPDELKSQPVIGVLPDNKIVIHSIYFPMVNSEQDVLYLYPDRGASGNIGPIFSIGNSIFGIAATLSQAYHSTLNGIIVSLSHNVIEFNGIAIGIANKAEYSRFFSMQTGCNNYLGNSKGINFQAGIGNHAKRSGGVNLQFGLNNDCDITDGFSLQAGINNSANGDGFGIQIGLLNDNGFFYMPIINFVF